MSEYHYNLRGQSNSVFKVPTIPTRHRNNVVDTQNVEISTAFKKAEEKFEVIKEKFEVIKRICTPEEVEKVLENVMNGFHSVCYDKVAEQIRSSSQASSMYNGGISACPSVYSVNVPLPGPSRNNYAMSTCQRYVHDAIPDQFSRQNFSTQTTGNNFGLLNMPITNHAPYHDRQQNYSDVNDTPLEPFVAIPKSRPVMKDIRSRKVPQTVNDTPLEPFVAIPKSRPVVKGVRSRKLPQTKTNTEENESFDELRVLPSDDESDSLSSMFFKGKKKTISKPSTGKITNESNERNSTGEKHTRRFSVSLSRVNVDSVENIESSDVRKRKTEKDPSPDSTTMKLKITKRTAAAASRRPKRNSVTTTRKQKASLVTKAKPTAVRKKPTVISKTQEKVKNVAKLPKPTLANGIIQKSMVGYDQDDGSFFGDVSSILGVNSLHLSNSEDKNPSKHSSVNRNEMPSHMFSPFANIRSTSGFSAISTPLSKTLSQNVLGKRLKKPNVVAELKDQLSRKPRKKPAVQKDIRPIEKSKDSESEMDLSDFSD